MGKKNFRLGDRVQLKAHGKDFRGTVVGIDKNPNMVKVYWGASAYSFEELRVENKKDLIKLRWVKKEPELNNFNSNLNDQLADDAFGLDSTTDPMNNYIPKVEFSNDLDYDEDSDDNWDPIYNERQDSCKL